MRERAQVDPFVLTVVVSLQGPLSFGSDLFGRSPAVQQVRAEPHLIARLFCSDAEAGSRRRPLH